MTTPSQVELVRRVQDKDDPLSGLGIFVAAHQIAEQALGISLMAAATLGASAISGWFPFTAWCATQGIRTDNMPMHIILPSVYGWLSHSCNEQKDLDRLNRRVFGSSRPW